MASHSLLVCLALLAAMGPCLVLGDWQYGRGEEGCSIWQALLCARGSMSQRHGDVNPFTSQSCFDKQDA
jgi:hypothetical protein